MPISAAIETIPRMLLTRTSIAGGMRAASGTGSGGPGYRCRQTPAPKQKTLNRTNTLPLVITSQCGKRSIRSAFAPIPLAIATRPVRTHAGSFRSGCSAVGSEFSTPVGAVLDARRTVLHVGRAILYLDALSLSLLLFSTIFGFAAMPL